MKRLFTVRTCAAVAVAIVVVTAATAYAAIPDGGGTIAACYAKNSGAVRVIDAEAGSVSHPRTHSVGPARMRVVTAF
jgi:hypothetical protein